MLLTVLDLAGIAVFAASGALAGVAARLDLFGVVTVAVLTGLGGGVIRDVLLGLTPPTSLRRWPYLLAPVVVGLLVFAFHTWVTRLRRAIEWADAFGLALFATAGSGAALAAGAPGVTAVVVGLITAIGGGVIRDVLVGEVPQVLRREVYAVPALLGAAVVVVGHDMGLPPVPVAIGAAGLVLAVRIVAMLRGWNAPLPPAPRDRP
ncbi:trimeric intracellular cation channel family protein [Pseudonocardia humida]|uniref:Trimeric intracellular cation channel family protein n=1 Tax=Pseudonocardia humida TaxID=2800819 RepID=A0ABT0ZXV7_9PSEU|nr:trimeric intracellular cation channel family protein [Pseudonocardia humida]MCO1655459.1 trimeric intracellular cation channel family protein [Pseudonocardia humida]